MHVHVLTWNDLGNVGQAGKKATSKIHRPECGQLFIFHLGYEVLHNPLDDMQNTTLGDLCICAGTIVVQILVGS